MSQDATALMARIDAMNEKLTDLNRRQLQLEYKAEYMERIIRELLQTNTAIQERLERLFTMESEDIRAACLDNAAMRRRIKRMEKYLNLPDAAETDHYIFMAEFEENSEEVV